MDRTDAILKQAVEICEAWFGLDYHSLEVNTWPRIASYYCAKRMYEGHENIFKSMRDLSAAVHKYNRNLITGQRFREDLHEAAQAIASRGVARFEGRDEYEQVTGKAAPEDWHYEKRPDQPDAVAEANGDDDDVEAGPLLRMVDRPDRFGLID